MGNTLKAFRQMVIRTVYLFLHNFTFLIRQKLFFYETRKTPIVRAIAILQLEKRLFLLLLCKSLYYLPDYQIICLQIFCSIKKVHIVCRFILLQILEDWAVGNLFHNPNLRLETYFVIYCTRGVFQQLGIFHCCKKFGTDKLVLRQVQKHSLSIHLPKFHPDAKDFLASNF